MNSNKWSNLLNRLLNFFNNIIIIKKPVLITTYSTYRYHKTITYHFFVVELLPDKIMETVFEMIGLP